MARHRSFEEKLEIIEYYLKHGNIQAVHKQFNVSPRSISDWVRLYQEKGPESLRHQPMHQTYTKAFKSMVVEEYLNQSISYRSLAMKYNIRASSTVLKWVREYTEGKQVKSTFGGKPLMVKSRQTTYQERLDIAQYYEANEVSIRELSERFNVTYQQAYQYVKKYEAAGKYGLEDRRGKRKPEDALNEVDQLKRALEQERRQRRKVEVENAFLKKLEELERRQK